MEPKKYSINGKEYYQKPLVLGQLIPLIKLLEGKVITDVSPLALIEVLGESLSRCMAVVLIPEGVGLKEKDIDALEAEFYEHLALETAMQVASDFFLCNPLSSLSSKFRAMVTGIRDQIVKDQDRNKS